MHIEQLIHKCSDPIFSVSKKCLAVDDTSSMKKEVLSLGRYWGCISTLSYLHSISFSSSYHHNHNDRHYKHSNFNPSCSFCSSHIQSCCPGKDPESSPDWSCCDTACPRKYNFKTRSVLYLFFFFVDFPETSSRMLLEIML